MAISITKPSIKRSDMNAVLTCLVSDTIGPGGVAKKLVGAMAKYFGSTGGAAFREYNRAIGVALDSLNIAQGSSIIISPLSPEIYVPVIKAKGYSILYCDVDPNTGCISAPAIEKLMSSNPAAILLHAPLGFVPDIKSIEEYEIPIIEDISHCVGGNTKEHPLGSYGKFTIVSMEADNIITSGGGSVVLAKGRQDYSHLKSNIESLTADCFLSDLNAALGLVQFETLERYIQRRKEIASHYAKAMMRSRHKTLSQNDESENVYYSFPVFLSSGMKEVAQYAKKKKIQTRPAFAGCALETADLETDSCPHAQSLLLRTLLFPLYPSLGKQNVEYVAKVLSTLP